MGPWNGLKTWVDYLFPSVKVSGNGDIVFEEEDSEHEKGDTFLSFHRQAGRPYLKELCWLVMCQPG